MRIKIYRRKFSVSILSMIIMITTIFPVTLFAGGYSIGINVGSVNGIAGESVVVPVMLSHIPQDGLVGTSVIITFDSSKLTLTDISAGEIIPVAGDVEKNIHDIIQSPGKAKIFYFDNNAGIGNPITTHITTDGVLAILKFDIDASASGEYTLGVDTLSEVTDNTPSTIPYTNMNVATGKLTITSTAMSYTATYRAGEHGSIAGTTQQIINIGGNGTEVTATADTGYHFVSWSDNGTTATRTDRNVTGNIDVTANFGVASNGGGSGGGGASTAPQPSTPKEVIVIVNGEKQNAGTEAVTEKDGIKTVDIIVNSDTISKKIDAILKQQAQGLNKQENMIQVPVANTDVDKLTAVLTGDIISKMDKNNFQLSVKSNNIDYIIPASEIGIEKVANMLNVSQEKLVDIKIEIKIENLSAEKVKQIEASAKAQKFEVMFPPVEFTVVAKTTDTAGKEQKTEVKAFSNYVQRVMEIPVGVDHTKITTGIVYNADGTFSHVPTDVFEKNGKWYARLNSLTNSDYTIIYNPITVASVENHWSKNAVNDMASRLVVKNPETFEPNAAITRGEFAEYIVKAIGLFRTGTSELGKFSDVTVKNEMADAITSAVKYDIIAGYADGTFKPEATITREEAMAMYARAMDVVKLKEIDNNKITTYKDTTQISQWAYGSVKKVISTGVFNGRTVDTVAAKGTLTHAEAATAIRNLLVASGLINK